MKSFALFYKHAVPGQVKTRLAAAFGETFAAAAHDAFVSDLVARFRGIADERWLCYAPSTAAAHTDAARRAGADYRTWAQPAGDLGQRLQRFFEERASGLQDRVVVIGSDSPTLPRRFVEGAFDLLEEADVVLGPATDGGYYLVGQRGPARPIFENVDWSTGRVLEQTVAHMDRLGARLALLPPWYDVDTGADWQFLCVHVRALIAAGDWTLDAATARLVLADGAGVDPRRPAT